MSSKEEPAKRGLLKAVVGAAIVVVAVGAVAIGLGREVERGQQSAVPVEPTPPAEEARVVTVYYFHGETRCPTCRTIEARTAETIREEYADAVGDGRLRFETVNFDAPENLHFRDDYDLSFGSVIVQGAGADRPWENLTEVWTLVRADPLVFQAYLVEHIDRMLDAAG